jgi:calcium-translocating P-type ATPase
MFTETGLTSREAELSAMVHGTNAITKKEHKGFLAQYAASFGDPIIRILLVALGVNIVFMWGDASWQETAGIAFAVLLATLISTLSEYGSESAFKKLQEESAKIKCRIRRDGLVTELPINEIVVGDIIYLQAGDRIPADGRIAAGELAVDQSALNGETAEAVKKPVGDEFATDANDLLSRDRLFRGSVICSGEGVMVAEKVGDGTFYGRLAAEVQEETIDSPLKLRLAHLAKTISRFGYAAAVIVAAANLFNSVVLNNGSDWFLIREYFYDLPNFLNDVLHALTLGITVIVMAVPEGLPMMITVVLSANMRRMLKDNVLVRKLVGIETSGSLNILFTDKTGTLTRGKLAVTSFITESGRLLDGEQFKKHKLYQRAALNAFYNNGAQITIKNLKPVAVGGNATDRALLEYVMNDTDKLPVYEKISITLFNSKDKFSAAEVSHGEFFVKGAPENLLPRCVWAYDANGVKKPFAHPAALKSMMTAQARDAVRVLALCEGETKDLARLTLVGLMCIRDEIRKEARIAVSDVLEAGVQVVMVTGDNKDTAISVAAKLGLVETAYREASEAGGQVLTSHSLNQLSDGEVKRLLSSLRVVARALPSDKGRLVRLAQEMGMVTGMTGDGVNDAPALKKADVGFAMGDGTEIAKEAGDIVILDNNFASISKAILYGRTIFKSIRKFLIFQLTINLCAVGVSVIGPFIGVSSPVTIIQMLWINMIMDTLAGLAYAGEMPLQEYMREKPKKRGEPIINKYMYNQILTTGLYSTFICLLFFKLPFVPEFYRSEDKYLLTAFFALFIFTGVFNSLNARTYRLNLFSYISGNKMFISIMLAVSVIQILLIYYGGALFRTAGLKLHELAFVVLLAASVLVFDLGRKLVLRINKRKGFI